VVVTIFLIERSFADGTGEILGDWHTKNNSKRIDRIIVSLIGESRFSYFGGYSIEFAELRRL